MEKHEPATNQAGECARSDASVHTAAAPAASIDPMRRVVLCKYCGRPEYYGDMRWHSARCMCRACYRADYEERAGKLYVWDDLDGAVPTLEDYNTQEASMND